MSAADLSLRGGHLSGRRRTRIAERFAANVSFSAASERSDRFDNVWKNGSDA